MMQSEQINEIAAALAKAQSEMGRAVKDSNNPFFKSKYADLSSVWDACQGALNANGLAVAQVLSSNDAGQPLLVTTLMHTSGQWIRSSAIIPLLKPDPQTMGSAITYMRRYSLAALVGVVQEDDDGEKAQARGYVSKAEMVNKEQLKELLQIMSGDHDYMSKLLGALKARGIHSLEQIPADMYEQVKTGAIKNNENKKTQNVA